LHEVGPGTADRAYGIHVAKLAGLPRNVTARAEEVLGVLAKMPQPCTPPRCEIRTSAGKPSR
jgi:DNA mismatch repair protein MutS